MCSGKVSVIKHVVTESITGYGVVEIIILVCIPVVRQLFGTKHQNRLVFIFVVFDNCKCSKGFTKTNRVSENATVKLFKLADNSKNGISLEVIEHAPNFRFLKSGCFIGKHVFRNVFQELVEYIVQRYKVQELRRVLVVCSRDVFNDLLGYDLHL